jgi:hypothetical protein
MEVMILFPIPDSLVKLINKWFNKENSVFVRDEPGDINMTWERTTYLSSPTKRIKTITYNYNMEHKKETYEILYDDDGDVQGAKLISDMPQKTR